MPAPTKLLIQNDAIPAYFTWDMTDFIRGPRESVTKEIVYAEACRAHRTGDHRRTAIGILSDANGNARQAVTLQTKFPTKVQAQLYLRANWPTIEKMARDALASETFEGGQIELVMV